MSNAYLHKSCNYDLHDAKPLLEKCQDQKHRIDNLASFDAYKQDLYIYLYRLSLILIQMSLWSSYRNLSPRTRLLFGAGLMAYATAGMWWSPKVEEALGMAPSQEEQAELERKLSVKVSSVER
ncbi:hypothetical protein EMCG_01907 [[Emmonsia] crescens]|uniref:Uncharacterized protein n=1 Tax=[Emmonsia] crescens TaxID=73230 RepID=A0A0G2I0A0_9EURO|nr:hypothetical protein EMCG_01907 [Emmonsia crescens UAMH 3008]